MFKKNDDVYTPRFCTVRISEVFDTYEEMVKAGYREPTYYYNEYGTCEINGKTVGEFRMKFACSPPAPWRK